MPPDPTGSLSINEPAPYHYGDTLTFTSTSSKLRGAHPMVEVAMFQDYDQDGEVETGLFDGDLVFVALNPPEQPVLLRADENTDVDATQPSKGVARLLAYGWKGGKEYIIPLDSVAFDVEP